MSDQSIWTKFAARIPTKTETLSEACDVTWTEMCKQTSTDSSVSSFPFVLNK